MKIGMAVFVLSVAICAATKADIYLTINQDHVDESVLYLGEMCSIEVNSSASDSYAAFVGQDPGGAMGGFEATAILPEAGNVAVLVPYEDDDVSGYYALAEDLYGGIGDGTHFVFEYSAESLGRTTIRLLDENRNLVDSVEIAVLAPRMSSRFSYQGTLYDGDSLAEGVYDIQFRLFLSKDPSLGPQVGETIVLSDVQIVAGAISVQLDSGKDLFDNRSVWLEIAVRPGEGGGSGDFVVLSPRQEVLPVPYAMYAEKAGGSVPIGTVIDWWRPDSKTPLPEAYQICDGSWVGDPASPLYGKRLPDLRGKFVMGAAAPDGIGVSGGDSNHTHGVNIAHSHGSVSTSASGAHAHSIDVPALTASSYTESDGLHGHVWAEYYVTSKGDNQWLSYGSSGYPELLVFYAGDGMGAEGAGYFPLALVGDGVNYSKSLHTTRNGLHGHEYSLDHDHPAFTSSSNGQHSHIVDVPSVNTQNVMTSSGSNLPPYYGLLKIMRIR